MLNKEKYMKKSKRIIAILLCLLLLFSGCKKKAETKNTKTDIIKQYQDALECTRSSSKYTYKVNQTKTTTVGTQVFEEHRQQSVSRVISKDNKLSAEITETVTIGDDIIEIKQTYVNNHEYIQINDGCFSSNTSQDAFMAQFAPAILLNPNRYKSTDKKDSNGITVILFSDPLSAEDWALPSSAIMNTAHGDATIDSDGNLIASTYHISYTDGPAIINLETTVSISYPEALEIAAPDPAQYTEINALQAPKMLEIACLYVDNAASVRTSATSDITGEAFTLNRNHVTNATITFGEAASTYIDIAAALDDYSNNDAPNLIHRQIKYENGIYEITQEDSTESNPDVTQEQVLSYCRNLLLGSIPPAAHLTAADSEVLDGHTILTFHASSAISKMIYHQASEALYGSPEFISEISTAVDDVDTEFYLTINNQTGFPTAFGYQYQTTHAIDNASYKLSSNYNQTFYLNAAQENNSQEPTAPMFYSVTDDNGNMLWILASTEYGDARSTNLSHEVYAALTEAQVLVMQFAYNAALDAYGTSVYPTAQAPLGNEIYQQLLPYLHLTGIPYTTAIDCSAASIEYVVRNHFIRQGYRLHRQGSIQNRIYQFAVPSGKRVDVIEPQGSPVQFAATLSPEAQEVLLQHTLNKTPALESNAYKLLDALYYGRDSEIISLLSFEAIADDPLITEELMEKLYSGPAEGIAQNLSSYLTQGKKAFAVIDVQYLIFTNNVIERLQAMGYTVTRH